MRKIGMISLISFTFSFAVLLNAAQQVRQQNVSSTSALRAKTPPASEVPPPNSTLDETLRWIQQKFPSPFEVNVQAGGSLRETVSYSTTLVDWKGCTVHFRSEREHTFNGEIDKHTVDQ